MPHKIFDDGSSKDQTSTHKIKVTDENENSLAMIQDQFNYTNHKNIFFNETKAVKYVPRAAFIDLEPTVIG